VNSRAGVIVIALVFLTLRIALLIARQPFFDELFTMWITAKPFDGIVRALLHDSGPPLYYFVIHALRIHTVFGARIVSLVCASVSFVLLVVAADAPVRRRDEAAPTRGRRTRASAATFLLAVFPPAVLFAVDARAYAMCAMFVTIGILALDRDRYDVAAIAFVFAAYSHYYGFFFFPLLLVRWRALVLALIAFAPGLWLALHQPRDATAWISREWPEALFARPPTALIVIMVIAIIAAAIHWNRFTTMTVVPIACVIVLMIAGRSVYLPMRFESVIAPPLVLAIATSLQSWKPAIRRAMATALIATSVIICVLATFDHAQRPVDDYRAAALWSARLKGPLVASGYCYLETIVNGRPDAIAFPPEQAEHPGWRAEPRPGSMPPVLPFYWIGERGAPELSILRRTRRVQPIYANARALVARVM